MHCTARDGSGTTGCETRTQFGAIMTEKIFGGRVKRVEDPRLLRGQGRFIDDIRLPNMAHAAFVRSPFAHARLTGIDKSAAEAMDGVIAVYGFNDLRPHLTQDRLPVEFPSGVPNAENAGPFVLVKDEAMYAGECVAIVIAETRHIAEDAAALVEMDFDPLPAGGDCKAALEPDAPKAVAGSDSNVMMEMLQEYGDAETAFASAPTYSARKSGSIAAAAIPSSAAVRSHGMRRSRTASRSGLRPRCPTWFTASSCIFSAGTRAISASLRRT